MYISLPILPTKWAITRRMNQILTKQIQLIYTPKVIPWGQRDKQTNKQMDGWTDGQIFTQYSGISSHSLMGVRIVVECAFGEIDLRWGIL
jgi:hypothetical protein